MRRLHAGALTMPIVSASIIELARTRPQRRDATHVTRKQHARRGIAEQRAGAEGQRVVGNAARRELQRHAGDTAIAQRLHHAAADGQRIHESGARVAADIEHERRTEIGVAAARCGDDLLRKAREAVRARR